MKHKIQVGGVQAALVRDGSVRRISINAPVERRSQELQQERGRPPARSFRKGPVKLRTNKPVRLSPGDQHPLIKIVVEEFCPRFVPQGTLAYIGDAEGKFLHLEADYLRRLGVVIPAPAKMPDVIVHDTARNWLLLIQAVTSAGPVDGKRRKELKELFSGCKAGLVFVTAFSTRQVMRGFLTQISWETEVWVAEDPEHLIHFNKKRFLGPYPDAMPTVQ